MAISGTKGQGWRAIPAQYRKDSDRLTSMHSATAAQLTSSIHQQRRLDRLQGNATHGDNE